MPKINLGKEIPHSEQKSPFDQDSSVISSGQWYMGGASKDWWCASPNKNHALVYQGDGNLCLYFLEQRPAPYTTVLGTPKWHTGTADKKDSGYLQLETNGNLLLMGHDLYGKDKEVLWESHTGVGKPTRLFIENDGNLVLYADNYPTWASMTNV